jgi:hypothetical protein
VVCGHSHLPGLVPWRDRLYVNTGSWTFAESQVVVWKGGTWSCRDWISGREYRDEGYRQLLDGSLDDRDFWTWWRENYMGLLRFREGEEVRGSLRSWQGILVDQQAHARRLPHVHGPPVDRRPRRAPDGNGDVEPPEDNGAAHAR